ncbi:MAG: bifunctional oligoribonuclease/PAP phosphatase NrnA [Zetaproteobacteria bacterium]|nr:MAG: bifunctional oligoribonuclease/PAP phosphatase NrnA [Zetaproteobacteria bacterium]
MITAEEWRPLLERLERARGVLLTTHQNPDGDGIGSMLALWHHLRRRGARVAAHCIDPVPRIYRFLAGSEAVGCGPWDDPGFDTIISLDCGARGRLAQPERFFAGRTLINIDHHRSNKRFGDLNFVDSDYCATGVMVHGLIAADGGAVTREIAEAVYVALVTDTGSFRYRGVTAAIHRLAAELVEAGVDPARVASAVYASNSRARMRLLTEVLATLRYEHEGRSAWLVVTREAYRRTGADVEDTEGLIDLAASVEGVEVAVMIRPHGSGGDDWKVSFRSRGRVQVGELAAAMGGGGHPDAAGCLCVGTLEEVTARVRARLTPLLAG